jgi:hypothetical protein
LVGLCNISPAQAFAPSKHELKLSPMAYAQKLVSPHQFECLVDLWNRESNWNPKSRNKVPVYQVRNGKRVALHAYGIAQVLGEKSKDPLSQIDKGLRYIVSRYDTPCKSLKWHKRHGWY